MANDSLIPTFQLNAALVGEQYCFDAWREAVRDFYDVEPLANGRSSMEKIDGWLLDGLIFTEVAFSSQSFSHHHSRHLENTNILSLQIYRQGRMRGTIGDIPFDMAPGEIRIFDFSREFHSVTDASVVAGVVIPHEAVGYDPARHPAHMSFSANSSVGQFLMKVFFALKDRLPEIRQDEASILADGFRGLIRGLVLGEETEEPATREFQAMRRSEIRSYVERHLADSDLGAEHLCDVFGVSRPSIYRDFADAGGVAQYIRDRRLDQIFLALRSTPPSRGRVQDIASRWGFSDPGHLSRLFRRRFGISPSDLAMSQRGSMSEPAWLAESDIGILRSWSKAI